MNVKRSYSSLVSLFSLSMLIMSACVSPAGQQNVEPVPTRTEVRAGTASPEVKKLSEVVEQATSESEPPASLVGTPSPKPYLGNLANEKVVEVTNCCGLTPEMYQANYLPEVQIWGDGRVIWTEQQENGSRKVLEGSIATEKLSSLIQRATEAGFFRWDELYTSPMSPTDLPTRCIFLQNGVDSRRVCEYYEGAPEAFHGLYKELVSGAGVKGTPFQPEKGFLIAAPVPAPDTGSSNIPVHPWDAGELSLSLTDAGQGKWIEGQALEKAWEIVNASPLGGFVQDGDSYYQISLQIPDVSFTDPPQQP